MPNWKKVITSGSNAELNNITASGDISSSGYIYGTSLVGANEYAFRYTNNGTIYNTGLFFSQTEGQYQFLDGSSNSVLSIQAGNGELTTGDVQWPYQDGSINQLLKTDGAGNIDFTSTINLSGDINTLGNISGSLTGSFKHLKATTIEGNSPLIIKGVSNLTFADPGDGVTFNNTNLYGNPVFHGDINIYSGSQLLDQFDNVFLESTSLTALSGEIIFGGLGIPTRIRGNGIILENPITASIISSSQLIGTIDGGTF